MIDALARAVDVAGHFDELDLFAPLDRRLRFLDKDAIQAPVETVILLLHMVARYIGRHIRLRELSQ